VPSENETRKKRHLRTRKNGDGGMGVLEPLFLRVESGSGVGAGVAGGGDVDDALFLGLCKGEREEMVGFGEK
jgi:hypothetical protein